MKSALIGCVIAFLALFPASDGGGVSLYQRWMEAYEKYLYQQMAANFEREERERNAEICQNPSESEVSIEQTASKEVSEETPAIRAGGNTDNNESRQENVEAVEVHNPNIETPTVATETESIQNDATPLYAVNGAVLAEEIQVFLFQKLSEANIAYFMPYALLICYQESKLDIYAENPNGRDKGLLQYRVEYVPWMDWRNPYQQIEYFVAQMANRAAAGCTVSEMISRHKTSDWGSYDQEYVNQVMQWESTLVRIR